MVLGTEVYMHLLLADSLLCGEWKHLQSGQFLRLVAICHQTHKRQQKFSVSSMKKHSIMM